MNDNDLDPFMLELRDRPGTHLRDLIDNRLARQLAMEMGIEANNANQLDRALREQLDGGAK